MDSVAMQRDVRDSLVKYVATYVAEASKKWYAARGLPHRRGYLLYGPPGCGKSSVINAIAGDNGLSICIITLSNPLLTDDLLEELFLILSDRAPVLLEDVDAAGIQSRAPDLGSKSSKKSRKSKTKTGVTLSGLLNCIDGSCPVEHRVLFMTANTPNSLDPALLRPGRIDKKILLANANRDVMEQQFEQIFADVPELVTFSSAYDIPKLSQAFATDIPEDILTPAEIQGYLLQHRSNPADAVKHAKAWADATIQEKASGCNVVSFAGQIDNGNQMTAEPSASITGTLPLAETTASDKFPPTAEPAMVVSSSDNSSDEDIAQSTEGYSDENDNETDESEFSKESDEDEDNEERVAELEAQIARLKGEGYRGSGVPISTSAQGTGGGGWETQGGGWY